MNVQLNNKIYHDYTIIISYILNLNPILHTSDMDIYINILSRLLTYDDHKSNYNY